MALEPRVFMRNSCGLMPSCFIEPTLQAAKRLSARVGYVQHGNVPRKSLMDNYDCLVSARQITILLKFRFVVHGSSEKG